MPDSLISGIAASPSPQHLRAIQDCICERPHPPAPVGVLPDEQLATWRASCEQHLIDSDMTYLVAGNNRAYWFMQLQDADRELARRQER